jgi:hypothetical protein
VTKVRGRTNVRRLSDWGRMKKRHRAILKRQRREGLGGKFMDWLEVPYVEEWIEIDDRPERFLVHTSEDDVVLRKDAENGDIFTEKDFFRWFKMNRFVSAGGDTMDNERMAAGEEAALPGQDFVNGQRTGYFDMDGRPLITGQTIQVLYHRGRGNYSSVKGVLIDISRRGRILLDGNTVNYVNWIRGKFDRWQPKWEMVENFPWGRGNRGIGETRYSLDGYPVKDRDQVVKVLSEPQSRKKKRRRAMDENKIAGELVRIARDLVGTEFDTKGQLDKYLKEHPDADRSKHTVKKQKKRTTMPRRKRGPDGSLALPKVEKKVVKKLKEGDPEAGDLKQWQLDKGWRPNKPKQEKKEVDYAGGYKVPKGATGKDLADYAEGYIEQGGIEDEDDAKELLDTIYEIKDKDIGEVVKALNKSMDKDALDTLMEIFDEDKSKKSSAQKIAGELVRIARELVAKRFLIDYRCPVCDNPLRGREEVVHSSTPPPKRLKCPTCGTRVTSAFDDAPANAAEPDYYYED